MTEKMVRLVVGALLIGLTLLLFRFTGLSYAAIGTLFFAVAFGILAGICLAPLLSGPLSEFAG
jgi:hypothetical protein